MGTRPYQKNSLDQIRELFSSGYRKVLLWLATGGGKTWVFCLMIKAATERGQKAIVVVRGRKLVDQASKRLFREKVPHGVFMAGHWNYRPNLPVQVCSIDTILSRKVFPPADLVIIDEGHLAISKGFKEFIEHYPDAWIVPVTATPWVPKSLRHIADAVVHPITMQQLIDEGYLTGFRYFGLETPDLSDVEVSRTTNDFVVDDLAEVMIEGQLTGKVVDHWKKLAHGRPTIGFAVNIKHSKLLTEKFIQAGIAAEHCDADTKEEEREAIISRLQSGETEVVFNVGILCTGVDIPCVSAIIMARPTKSRNLFIQQAGRGTRPVYEDGFGIETKEGRLLAIAASKKPDCIILDHAGNVDRHGFATDEPEVDLDGTPARDSHDKLSKICKNCFAVYRASKCPECGVEPPEAENIEIAESDDELKEITERDPVKFALKSLLRDARKKGKKPGWAYRKLELRFGYEASEPYLPQWYRRKHEMGFSNPFSRSRFKGFTG